MFKKQFYPGPFNLNLIAKNNSTLAPFFQFKEDAAQPIFE
jgi:hypothetical protein